MRGTELLVSSIIAGKLRQAEQARLARLARTAPAPAVRRDPCEVPNSPECLGKLKAANRPA